MKNGGIFLLGVCGIVVIVAVIMFVGNGEEPLVGGDRDVHGCLGSAGYTWDGDIGGCIREWEIDDNQREASKIAVDFLGRDGLTVSEVMGCFLVKLVDVDYNFFQVTLDNWVVEVGSFEDCVLAGFPVMESYPRQCSDGTNSWTEVLGSKDCVVDSDCVVFGRDGDCNCGCYNKGSLPSGTGGACFCAAPESCECVEGVCEDVFGV